MQQAPWWNKPHQKRNLQLEKLVMDVTQHDLNLQMLRLLTEYKNTGDKHYKEDAEYLRSEYEMYWDYEKSEFEFPEMYDQ